MEQITEPQSVRARQEAPAYRSFPRTATHGASDTRCCHGEPEDWRRNRVERKFGGTAK